MNSKKVAILDYGMGNLGSVFNMLKYLGFESIVSNKLSDLNKGTHLILPGVGHFDKAIRNIKRNGYDEFIMRKALDEQRPILGICLGMQLMCKNSEEGSESGLNLFDYEVKKFSFPEDTTLKIPHMGWNFIRRDEESVLFKNLDNKSRFYFVHSFYVHDNNLPYKTSSTSYGIEFISSFNKDNIYGVQFHPEKSHKFGKKLFTNFLNFDG